VTGREYRGMSAAERLADRRERLLSAAYTLFANPGFHSTTIERLCATARISNRAFYECFSGREELMRAVYNRCVDETLASVSTAIERAPRTMDGRIVAGVEEYIRFVTHDMRRARVMHLEVRRAGDVLGKPRQKAVRAFRQMIEGTASDLPDRLPDDLDLLTLGLIGAITELLIEWSLADPAPPIELVTATAVRIFRRTFLTEPAPR
jgi:AcrR family transcriptional regulator